MEAPSAVPGKSRAAGLYTIIAVKLGKAILLLLLALGILSLIGDDLVARFDKLLRFVRLDPEREFFVELGHHIESITPAGLKQLASGTLLYAFLLLVESIGLMFRTVWAGWLAIGETAFFIPVEITKLIASFTWTVTLILVVNSLIVLYLVRNRRRLFHHHGETPATLPSRAGPREDWEV